MEDLESILSGAARDYLWELYGELVELDARIKKDEQRLHARSQSHESCQRLMAITGIGLLTASALVAHTGDGKQYKNGRDFAASLGLRPREQLSGGGSIHGRRRHPTDGRRAVPGTRRAYKHGQQSKFWLQAEPRWA